MRAAWKVTTPEEGEKRLEQLARFLERDYESAARSLREGTAEMFTLQRLKLPPSLYKCLATTNVIESPQSGVSRRTANVVRPRQVAMYLAKTLTLRSLPEIGRRFGGRDHTTVLHAVRKIEALVSKDIALSEEVESLKRQLQE